MSQRGECVKISTESIWDEMMVLFRTHRQAMVAIAGVFIFLPAFASALFIEPFKMGTTPEAMMAAVSVWVRQNWFSLLVQVCISTLGGVALYRCLLPRTDTTTGRAISEALPVLIFVLLSNFLTSFIIVAGLQLFIVPGLYAAGRLFLASPAIIARGEKNVFKGLQQSFELTRDNGWRLIGMALIMIVVIFIAVFTASLVIGTLASFILPAGLSKLVGTALESLLVTLWTIGGITMAAATYRLATH
jgi:hypothetical protein